MLDRPGRAIGLRRGSLAVRAYDNRWPAEYERERAVLADLLNGVVERIEHVGSTAVVGLAAKPLIDIALGFSERALLEEGRTGLEREGRTSLDGGLRLPTLNQTSVDRRTAEWLTLDDRGHLG